MYSDWKGDRHLTPLLAAFLCSIRAVPPWPLCGIIQNINFAFHIYIYRKGSLQAILTSLSSYSLLYTFCLLYSGIRKPILLAVRGCDGYGVGSFSHSILYSIYNIPLVIGVIDASTNCPRDACPLLDWLIKVRSSKY